MEAVEAALLAVVVVKAVLVVEAVKAALLAVLAV